MTPRKVKAEVGRIRKMADDDESAHCAEDDLYLNVLAAIAEGRCADPAACAAEAVKTKGIDFHRWHA